MATERLMASRYESLESYLTYRGISVNGFDALRRLSPDIQRELLLEFYRKSKLPNVESFVDFLVKVNNIKWFKPEKTPSKKELNKSVAEYYRRLNAVNPPELRIIKNNWFFAMDAVRNSQANEFVGDIAWVARHAVRDVQVAAGDVDLMWVPDWNLTVADRDARAVARAAVRDARAAVRDARDAAKDAVWASAWNAAWDAHGDISVVAANGSCDAAKDAAVWTLVEDKMPEKGYANGNPFEVLIDGFYAKGAWPIGEVINETGKRDFVVFIPPLVKK